MRNGDANMESRKKRRGGRIVFAVLALLVIAGLTALPFVLQEQQEKNADKASSRPRRAIRSARRRS